MHNFNVTPEFIQLPLNNNVVGNSAGELSGTIPGRLSSRMASLKHGNKGQRKFQTGDVNDDNK